MKKKNLTVIAISAILTASVFTGCGIKTDTPVIGKIVGLDKNQIFQVEDLICDKPEYMLVLMDTQNRYKKDFGGSVDWNAKVDDDTTLQDFVREKVKENITVEYVLSALAAEKGVIITEEEKTKISKAADEYLASLNESEKSYVSASKEDVETVYTNYLLADKLYSQLTANIGIQVSDEESRVIKIQYIRMSTDKNKESKIKATFQDVTDLVNGGYQTFSREAKQYSEDEVVEKTIKKNEAAKLFEQEAFSLNTDEISNMIKDGNNYYLVYCVNSYIKDETAKNKQNIISSMKKEEFNKQYTEFLNKAKTDYNTDAWKDINLSDNENVNTTALMEKYNAIVKK